MPAVSVTVSDHKIVYTVKKVTATKIAGYTRDAAGLKEIEDDVNKEELWTAVFAVDTKTHKITRVTGLGYPNIDGHPGHTHDSSPGAWKYNVERGNNTVDRYVLDNWKVDIKSQKYERITKGKIVTDQITAEIEITCRARVLLDTKKKPNQK